LQSGFLFTVALTCIRVNVMRISIALMLCFSACKSWGKFWDASTTVSFTTPTIAATSYYTGLSRWNQYIVADGTHLTSTNTACTSTTPGTFGSCFAAGRLRFAEVPLKTSCSTITATDALSAFQWACEVVNGKTIVYTVGLRDDKRLYDLLDVAALKFKSNTLTVYDNGAVYYTTASAVWYTDTIAINNTSTGYNTSDTIYVVTSSFNSTTSIPINQPRISLVIAPGQSITATAGIILVNVSTTSFVWVEGFISAGATGLEALDVNNVTFSAFRNLQLDKGTANSLNVQIAQRNLFKNIRVAAGAVGILFQDIDGSLVQDIYASNVGAGAGISYQASSDFSQVNGSINNGSGSGMTFATTTSSVLQSFNSTNNLTDGILFNATATNLVFSNLTLLNNGGNGATFNSCTQITMHNLVASDNQTNAINLNTTSNNKFTGSLKLGALSCSVAGGTNPGLVTATCSNNGLSDAVLQTGVAGNQIYVNKVVVTDTANQSNSSGAQTFGTLTDFVNFERPHRGWGIENASAPYVGGHRTQCSGGTCRIWDFSVAQSDAVSRNANAIPDGNQTLTQIWSAGNSTLCSQFKGATWNGSACVTTFLKNAYELSEDGYGNDNGLCESNEHCLYSPNIAAYQGHATKTCVRGANTACSAAFSGGAITGVTLWRYTTNGY